MAKNYRAARGKPSSGEFEAQAFNCQQIADASMSKARYFDERLEELESEEARIIGEQPEQRANIEAITEEMRERFERAKEQRLCRARHYQQGADELRHYAKQARAFEARWGFNPYIDPFLDSVERLQRQQAREAKRKAKSGPKSKAKARR